MNRVSLVAALPSTAQRSFIPVPSKRSTVSVHAALVWLVIGLIGIFIARRFGTQYDVLITPVKSVLLRVSCMSVIHTYVRAMKGFLELGHWHVSVYFLTAQALSDCDYLLFFCKLNGH
jgi:hypothetical protein